MSLFAFVAMSSCTTGTDTPVVPEPKTSDESVKAELFGTWYAQYELTGTINGKTYQRIVEYYQFPKVLGELNWGHWDRFFFAEAGDENPIDNLAGGSGATGMFEYIADSDGTIGLQLANLDLAVYSLSYYEPAMRTLRYANGQLTALGADGQPTTFTRADEATEDIMMGWRTYLQGGDGEGGGTYETGINDKDADGPSRSR